MIDGFLATFINNDAKNDAPVASILGEGSLSMIVAILALASSIVSIGISVALYKKKTAFASNAPNSEE